MRPESQTQPPLPYSVPRSGRSLQIGFVNVSPYIRYEFPLAYDGFQAMSYGYY